MKPEKNPEKPRIKQKQPVIKMAAESTQNARIDICHEDISLTLVGHLQSARFHRKQCNEGLPTRHNFGTPGSTREELKKNCGWGKLERKNEK